MPDPSPTLAMLWEDASPADVLRERFDFTSVAAVQQWLTEVLRKNWGIEAHGCRRVVMSATNALAWLSTAGGPLVAKWSVDRQRFERLRQIAELVGWLDSVGVPVSAPVPMTNGRAQLEVDGRSLGVQRVIEGELLDVERLEEVRSAGRALGRMHVQLAAWPDASSIVPPDEATRSLPVVVEEWSAGVSAPGCDGARGVVRDWLVAAPESPTEVQLVHGDIRSANVLCRGGHVVAILDFDEVRWDLPVVEVARAAVLLGTQFHDWGPVSEEVRTAFVEGYESERPFSDAERAWYRILVLVISLRMVPEGADPTGWRAAAESIAHGQSCT